MKLLQWYIVNKKYVKYLKFFDNKIENIDYQSNLKPFIGIILNINNFNYVDFIILIRINANA